MEHLKLLEEDKGRPLKRELRSLRTRINYHKFVNHNALEAIVEGAAVGGGVGHSNEDGRLRMKITIRKHELKRLLEVTDCSKNVGSSQLSGGSSPSTFEQSLLFMRMRQLIRQTGCSVKGIRSRSWRPVLQSIPEEF